VAASPAMIAAGSPGVRRSSRKTKTATTSRTGTVAASRRAMKLTSDGQFVSDGQFFLTFQ
jgi:hypothetical protein